MPDTGSECVLLVEGPYDEHVVRQLCRRYEEVPAFSVEVTGNDAKLLDAIGPALIVPGRRPWAFLQTRMMTFSPVGTT